MGGSFSAGRAVGTYELDTSQARRAAADLLKVFSQIEQAQARLAQTKAPALPTAPKSPTTPGGPPIDASEIAKAQQAMARLAEAEARAATAAQRLASEQQRTTRAVADAAAAEAKHQRELANTAAAQDRAAKAAVQRQQAEARAARANANGGLGPALPRTIDGLSGSAAQLAGTFLTVEAARRTIDFAKTGAAINVTRDSFDNLAASAGTTGDVLLSSLQAAAQGTIKDAQLIQSANTGILLTQGQIITDLPELIKVARASAQATGQDIGFVFDSLVRGIARGSPQIIDNAGITLDAAAAFDTYAKSIGTTSDKLTDQQRQQATLQAVLSAGRDIVQQVGLDSESGAAKIAKAETAISNAADALATKLAPAAADAADAITKLLGKGDVFNDLQAQAFKGADGFDAFAAAQDRAYKQAGLGHDPVLAATLGVQGLTREQYDYAKALTASGASEQDAIARAKDLAGVLAAAAEGQAAYASTVDDNTSAYDAIAERLIRIAATGDTAARATAQALLIQKPPLADLAVATAQLEQAQQRQAVAAGNASIEGIRLTREHQNAAVAVDAETQAIADSIIQKQQAADQAERLSAAEAFIANIGKQVQAGLISAAEGARILGNEFGFAADQAARVTAESAKAARVNVQAEGRANIFKDLLTFGGQAATLIKEQNAQQVALRNRILQTGTAQEVLNLRQKDYNEAVKKYGKDSSKALEAENNLIAARQAAQRENTPKGGKGGKVTANTGLSALDQDAIQAQTTLQGELDEVNRMLQRGNLTAHQRNDLLERQRDLQAKIADETERQATAANRAALDSVKDAIAREKEAKELAGLRRQQERPGFSDEQKRQAALREQEILLEQQQRALDIQKEVKDAGGALPPSVQPPQAASAPPSVTAPQPVQAPLPLPNVAQLLPTLPAGFTIPTPQLTIEQLIIQVDSTGRGRVVNPPPGVTIGDVFVQSSSTQRSGG